MLRTTLGLTVLLLGLSTADAQDRKGAEKEFNKGRQEFLKHTEKGYKEAEEKFLKALDKDRSYAPAYAGLAETYALKGHATILAGQAGSALFAKALEYGRRAVTLDSNAAVCRRALGQAYMCFEQEEVRQAAYRELQSALQIDSNDAETHYLVWFLTDNKNTENRHIKRALELNQDLFVAHYGLGVLYARQQKYEEAAGHYARCINISRDNYLPYVGLGNAFSQRGLYDLSIDPYKRALKLTKTYPEVHMYLGLSYYYLDENKDARKQFEQFLKLAPNSPNASKIRDVLKDINEQ